MKKQNSTGKNKAGKKGAFEGLIVKLIGELESSLSLTEFNI